MVKINTLNKIDYILVFVTYIFMSSDVGLLNCKVITLNHYYCITAPIRKKAQYRLYKNKKGFI